MKRTTDEIRNAIDTTLSGASHDPTLFHRVVNASKGDTPPVKKKLTLSMALVLVLMLLAGTAFAATVVHGVTYFLTDRTTHPIEINPDLLMSNLTQGCTSEWLNATVQDAYWDGTELSVSIHVTPKDRSIPFAMLYDIGLDGESFDTIWLTDADFNSNIMPVEQWRDGKTGILLCYPKVTLSIAGTEDTSWRSLDYVHIPEENAVVLMLQMPVNSLTAGGQMVIRLDSVLSHPGDALDAANRRWQAQEPGESESATLSVYLPAMADPVAIHEHDWLPATCVSPMTCKTCGRTEGGLGEHSFPPAYCNIVRTCPVCTYSYKTGHIANPEIPGACYCGEIHP